MKTTPIAALLLLTATPALAAPHRTIRPPTMVTEQGTGSVLNPTTAIWTPSADDTGSPDPVARYTIDLYNAAHVIVKSAIDAGHPTVAADGTQSFAGLTPIVAALPLGTYTAQVCAETAVDGTGDRGCSTDSNPFRRSPSAPAKPPIIK